MILAAILVMELLTFILLFKGVLGYSFRDNKFLDAAGISMFVVYWGIETALPNGGTLLLFVEMLVPAVGAVLMFAGRKWNIFFIGIGICALFREMNAACLGAAILIKGGRNLEDISLPLLMMAALLLMAAVFAVLWAVFRKKREDIYRSLEKLNSLVLLPFVLVYPLFYYGRWASGEIEYLAEIRRGKNQINDGIVFCTFLTVAVMVCILISQKREIQKMLRQNEKCLREQAEQYKLLSIRDRELRKFRHDYNGHIAALQKLVEEADRQTISRYIKNLSTIKENLNFIRSNNIICDAILNQYTALCRDAQISLIVKGRLPDHLLILETDLCVIFSNAVKNAYEAARKCESEQRTLQIEFSRIGSFASVRISNPTVEKPVIKEGLFSTTKKDRENHGFGIENMMEAAKRSGSEVNWEYKDGRVITSILLRCSDQ